jgi:hypothetical protein
MLSGEILNGTALNKAANNSEQQSPVGEQDASRRRQGQAVSGNAEESEASPPPPSGESADRKPLRGEPRGESPTARCPKPARRNDGLANGPPKKMHGQLRWRW